MTLSELITASRDNGWNVVDEILYQTYLDTLQGSGSVSEQILHALQTFDATSASFVFTRLTDLDETPQNLFTQASSVILFLGGTYYNPNTYPVYLKVYQATVPIIGTTVPVHTIMIPALGQVVLDSTTAYALCEDHFSLAVTKGYEDSNTEAIATDVYCTVKYQVR